MRLSHAFVLMMILVLTATRPAISQTDRTDLLENQVNELRQQLAQTKLALDKAMAELKDIRAFLADKNIDQKIAEWKTERRALAEERRRVSGERRKLENARLMLHRTTAQQAADKAKAEQAKQASLKPKWNVQYMLGLIDKEQEEIYLRVDNDRVRLRRFNNIDPKNVKVRGTFLNKSDAPWRYSFEIRIAGNDAFGLGKGQLNGSWRVQTPLLGPGDLYPFDVTVPVQNAYDIELVQVGNVTADRPALQAATQTALPVITTPASPQ